MITSLLKNMPLIQQIYNLLGYKDKKSSENLMFKTIQLVSTFILLLGMFFISVENNLKSNSIICQGADEYTTNFCWIHGGSYITGVFQGKITGCYVDPNKLNSQEGDLVTSYYLWIPFLLTICLILINIPSIVWNQGLENNMIKTIIGESDTPEEVAHRFHKLRKRFFKYHINFGFSEMLIPICAICSLLLTNMAFSGRFLSYGIESLKYLYSYSNNHTKTQIHNPMCELFPTEIDCALKVGSAVGAVITRSHMCILSNNIFNQKYFLVLWFWWMMVIFVSLIVLISRFLRLTLPGFSKSLLMKKVNWSELHLSNSEWFVLDVIHDQVTETEYYHIFDHIQDNQQKQEEII